MSNGPRRPPSPNVFVFAACVACFLLVVVAGASCDGCLNGRHGATVRCGVCATSATCLEGLACVNGVCETAPPSCHVEIGL